MSAMGGELSLSCPSCGERFPSALPLDEATFVKVRLIDHAESCRNCGHTQSFTKGDYYFFERLG